MNLLRNSFVLLLAFCVFSACEKFDPKAQEEKEATDLKKYFESNNIVADTLDANGLFYVHGKTGIGNIVEKGKKVSLYYQGYLVDGSVFDTNFGAEEPFRFTIGNGEVIEGWEKGILGMRVGDTGTLIIKSNFAYGSVKNGPIPAYSSLIFDLIIVGVE